MLPKKKTFYQNDTADLASIAVLLEYRGKGIAEELTCAFLEELKNKGVIACRLGVEAENLRARRFYEKIGLRNLTSKEPVISFF